ncbi:S8 family peptidase [Mycolicibacterium sp. Dal123E01]|uniref:S8 family peptidase n=1 Tax=Mycolicibacterium sp. Dal123E01 TaxID=3457578 RepID=UPI00403E5476
MASDADADAPIAPIPRDLIEYILMGGGDGRRRIQDTPVLLEVWNEFATKPEEAAELLITAEDDVTATELAAEIYRGIHRGSSADDPGIAPLQRFVAARLWFGELLETVVPMTSWWQDPTTQGEFNKFTADTSSELVKAVIGAVALREQWLADERRGLSVNPNGNAPNNMTPFERFLALCALVSYVGLSSFNQQQLAETEIADAVLDLLQTMQITTRPLVQRVALNRRATPAIARSVPTVKADAARRLFEIDCAGINWAVLDTGIDRTHPAFGDRVRAVYDFTDYRRIVTPSNNKEEIRLANIERLKAARDGKPLPEDAGEKLQQIAQAILDHRPIPWDLVDPIARIDESVAPFTPHGTHVAGIIGAEKYDGNRNSANGMCPGIGLYDFRVLKSEGISPDDRLDTESAIIAALQFIRYLNGKADRIAISGVNMSLQIPYDVTGDACGLSPVCREAERLIDSGVVVVAAAGNLGWQETMVGRVRTNDFPSFTITDPGNAQRVITVGSTHAEAPLSHGVSYFSSRGPTVDGRLKPDLIAPGEQITAPIPKGQWGTLDGTSMAAPHVSGAAAMLMARYRELIGKPDLIKKILCGTATDLGRDRTFQGHGLVDVLRALQSQ